MNIRAAVPGDYARLLHIWQHSVLATHAFLSAAEIADLVPVVRDVELPKLELWVVCDEQSPVGFTALSGSKIEALFVAPWFFRRGAGRRLLIHARRLAGTRLTVDVNEQNPGAIAFYESNGFTVIGRSPVDSAGRPFPLLHMIEAEAGGSTQTRGKATTPEAGSSATGLSGRR
ncbi:MAG TPA: GNAT family N-acetyltransferase [Burkholderiales bacterium]|nr:GNAT family N-acetyltransferase [Burkholderiales bacterium]